MDGEKPEELAGEAQKNRKPKDIRSERLAPWWIF